MAVREDSLEYGDPTPFLDNFSLGQPALARQTPHQESARPFAAGDFYAFHNLPSSKFALQERPRYAAFRVLEVTDEWITIAPLDGVFDHPPMLVEVRDLTPLRLQRPPWHAGAFGHGKTAVFMTPVKMPPEPELEFRWLGSVQPRSKDLALIPKPESFAPWRWVSVHAEGEWRWIHDRERYMEERERSIADTNATLRAEEERDRQRRKGLTWDRLLSERHFERWRESPPFPPLAFADAARATVERTIRTIAALGPKPRRPAVRIALRECVEWFNVESERAGDAIETEERQDILLLLADICFVARQRSLVEEIEQWRTW